jgi:signal transduction histidine kinase
MNLQAKLTLGSVLLETLIVGVISAVYLVNTMQGHFDDTLGRANLVMNVATDDVKLAVNSKPALSLREALRDPALHDRLQKVMSSSDGLIEVSVVSPENEILADSDPDPNRLGTFVPEYSDFQTLVKQTPWYHKLWVLLQHDNLFYQLAAKLGKTGQPATLFVRVIVYPALIKSHLGPNLKSSAQAALLSIIAAVGLTFLFSALAFRRLGQIEHMLDLAASGVYEPEKPGAAKLGKDELSVITSKVNMLSQQLRGAQFEVSDLRGNIDHLLTDLEDAVVIFNRERRLVFASGSVEKFLGKQRADLAGKSISDIFPPSTTLGLLVAQSSQTGRAIRNRRIPVSGSGGAKPNDVTAGIAVVLLSIDQLETLPGGVNTGSGLLVRLRDPEAQRKIGRELQTADRLAAISRISGGVAHEVKNPLNAILLHVEVARAKLSHGDTDVAPQMEIISREILRLDRVVKTFLDFTRPVDLNLSDVPLHELVGEIVDLARPQADAAKIRINVWQEGEDVEVRIDRDLLKQAFLNIVVNAMQAMPEGGELRFESSAGEDSAEIRITDSGAGIPPELRDKIFRLYFTTKKEGSGIGLAMTFRIVQLHDGTIDFTSEPGKGTTFFIRLPIAV